MDNVSGRKWARSFLGIALFVSLIGNIAHTVLADSTISLWLRVPGAVIWPVFAFGGIEILVRMNWRRTGSHIFARFMVLLPVLPAAITSYEHLRSMLEMMGEREFIADIGPAVVDGMMLGCTLVLLFTQAIPVPDGTDADEAMQRLEMLAVEQTEQDWDIAAQVELGTEMLETPVSPAPQIERTARSPRGGISPALRSAVEALIAGERPEAGLPGASPAVVGRYSKVLRVLKDNPNAAIDTAAEKVKPELVDLLRSHAREVAPR